MTWQRRGTTCLHHNLEARVRLGASRLALGVLQGLVHVPVGSVARRIVSHTHTHCVESTYRARFDTVLGATWFWTLPAEPRTALLSPVGQQSSNAIRAGHRSLRLPVCAEGSAGTTVSHTHTPCLQRPTLLVRYSYAELDQ